jgi:uncharacterized protein DUF5666
VSRCVCVLFVLGGLVYAQAAATLPSLESNAVAGEAANTTAKNGAGAAPGLPLPPGNATVLGGTIRTVDHLRDRMVLQVFGGGRTVVTFDDRTRVYRDGKAASVDELKNGDRVSADTVLDGTRVFARIIRIAITGAAGRSSGQVVSFEPARGELILRDTLSLSPQRMRLAPDALVIRGNRSAQPADLRPGTLVDVTFLTDGDGRAVARQVSILAAPGARFTFVGRVDFVDLLHGFFVLVDPRDNKNYELHFDPTVRALYQDIRVGADVIVSAGFDGRRYTAKSITLSAAPSR